MKTAQENTDSQGVWEDFHGRLRSFVSRRVKQPANAEDVVQEILLHIYRNLSTVKDAQLQNQPAHTRRETGRSQSGDCLRDCFQCSEFSGHDFWRNL